jgi:methyl coenzyme M reductase alpha subunit
VCPLLRQMTTTAAFVTHFKTPIDSTTDVETAFTTGERSYTMCIWYLTRYNAHQEQWSMLAWWVFTLVIWH